MTQAMGVGLQTPWRRERRFTKENRKKKTTRSNKDSKRQQGKRIEAKVKKEKSRKEAKDKRRAVWSRGVLNSTEYTDHCSYCTGKVLTSVRSGTQRHKYSTAQVGREVRLPTNCNGLIGDGQVG